MRCTKCGAIVNNNAVICPTCGEDFSAREVDAIVDKMIKQDKAESNPETEVPKKPATPKTEPANKRMPGAIKLGKTADIMGYIAVAAIIVLIFSMLFSWFGLKGRGAYQGFIKSPETSKYFSKNVIDMTAEDFDQIDANTEILTFSAKSLLDYVNQYGQAYAMLDTSGAEKEKSYVAQFDILYIKGFYLIFGIGFIGVFILLIDKKFRLIEYVRGGSILVMVIILLNFMTIKIPFFSMFVVKARNLIQLQDLTTAVTTTMAGITANNQFYPYAVTEKFGFYLAISCCVIWFIASTVIVEMRKNALKKIEIEE